MATFDVAVRVHIDASSTADLVAVDRPGEDGGVDRCGSRVQCSAPCPPVALGAPPLAHLTERRWWAHGSRDPGDSVRSPSSTWFATSCQLLASARVAQKSA
jgi:hypothetical protein